MNQIVDEERRTRASKSGSTSSSDSREDDECDQEIASILHINQMPFESPRSLTELDVDAAKKNSCQQNQEQESYIADGEDNQTSVRRIWKRRRSMKDQLSDNIDNSSCLEQNLDSPPLILRKKQYGEGGSIFNTLKNNEVNTPSSEADDKTEVKNVTHEASENNIFILTTPQGPNPSKEDKTYSNGFPTNPFPAGLSPSNHDSVCSEYGSLDYSSGGTDQSYDTIPASNRSFANSSYSKRSYRKKKSFKGNAFSGTVDEEQLPLVPEHPLVKTESFDHNERGILEEAPKKTVSTKKATRQVRYTQHLEEIRGSIQRTSCNNVFFAILFSSQLTLTLILGMRFGPQAFGFGILQSIASDTSAYSPVLFTYENVIILTFTSGFFAILISNVLLVLMTMSTNKFIPMSLFLAMGLSLIWSFIGILLSPQTFIPIMGIVSLGVSVGYTFVVWDRIPFVTAQLNAALSAIKEVKTIIVLACILQVIGLFGIVFYFFTCIGIYDYLQIEQNSSLGEWKFTCYTVLIISFIWTFQVLVYILRTTACGVVHKWWHSKPDELNHLDTVGGTLLRCCSFSFGSICLGSLFIGPTNFLRRIADKIRPNKEEAAIQSFVFLQELIVTAIDWLNTKFSSWAFVYVGIYGYDYFVAGSIALYLFQKRGWNEIIGDRLLGNVLLVVSLIIGGIVGCFAVQIEDIETSSLYSLNNPSFVAFIIGASTGVVLSNILFSIVTGSVDTVVICFAGSPDELEENHPAESQDIRAAWKEAWPGTIDRISKSNSVSAISPGEPRPLARRRSLEKIFV